MNALARLALPGLLLAGSLGAGPDPWAQLKVGLTPEAATALLGAPMLQTHGHGMETWIYEHGAEVLIRDTVLGWTPPGEGWRSRPAATPPLARTPAPAILAEKPVKLPVTVVPLQKSPTPTKADVLRLLGFAGDAATRQP